MQNELKPCEMVSDNPMDYVRVALALETLAYHNKGFLCCQDNSLISEQVQTLLKEALKKARCLKND
ncbi:MAG: hypothetical protein IJW86_09640 [Clostridia bacterium]|nr:hypothetical protein [Clostridia bacterium]